LISLVAACLLCFGFVFVAAADQESLWTYNDSEMYLVTKDQVSDIRYQKTPPGFNTVWCDSRYTRVSWCFS
jgi:hypothetical protein